MNIRLLTLLFAIFAFSAAGQTSWLDRELSTAWNTGNGVIPTAPRGGEAPTSQMCRGTIRAAETINDRALTRAGWFLFGPTYSYGTIAIVTAMASVDGMCRPNEYNGFVFVGNRFAGTLSPTASMARTDGAMGTIQFYNPENLTVQFVRYSDNDGLCCPSRTSYVNYELTLGTRPLVKAVDVDTRPNCENSGPIETQDNVVSGTVTYRTRMALPPSAVLTVSLMDVSRADAPATVIARQQIDTAGKQVPFDFSFAYDRTRIQERNRYAIRAEIRDGGRLLYTTDTNYPVITQGSPRNVDIVVVPVGRPGPGTGQASGTIRGTVTYRQRIAFPADSEITVKLVDAEDPEGTPVAETTVTPGTRQVPVPFELGYERRDVNLQRSYVLFAEIRSNKTLRFRSEAGTPVNLRNANVQGVEIVVSPASDEPEVITGQSLNVSKFGTGSMQIEGRGSELVIRGTVMIRTDGTATVSINRLNGTISFEGKLVAFDSNTARIMVQSSGDADASGEIEVRYSGRNLNALLGNNLVLDGQNVALRF